MGEADRAEPLLTRAVEASMLTLGDSHPDTLTAKSTLAGMYRSVGKYDEAEPLLKGVLEARARTLGEDHPATRATFPAYSLNLDSWYSTGCVWGSCARVEGCIRD